MSYSIQTNVNSLVAQENLRVNADFQSRTIQRLTSGFRINASGDDAAGLAIANKFRSDVAELTQGVRNANDGLSQLQIVDGGINNVSKMLDRLKTLASQSASATFTGNRTTLNNEYQALLTEINRQAENVGLGTGAIGGRLNKSISVYLGGGQGNMSNAAVAIDLAGNSNRIDSTALGLASTKVDGSAGVAVGNVDIRTAATLYSGNISQTFTFRLGDGSVVTSSVTGTGTGISGQNVVDQLNGQLSGAGITAAIAGSTGFLEFSSTRTFQVDTAAVAGGAATGAVTDRLNSGLSSKTFTAAAPGGDQTITFTIGSSPAASVDILAADSEAVAMNKIRGALQGSGVELVYDATTHAAAFQSSSSFVVTSNAAAGESVLTAADGGASDIETGATSVVTNSCDPTTAGDPIANATAALTAISNAVTNLGVVQGKVGTAQNKLQYAINLAQSQVSNFSAAESRIRDADVAAEAANLTKAQVLQQASLAAMAQANSAPQAVLALLRG